MGDITNTSGPHGPVSTAPQLTAGQRVREISTGDTYRVRLVAEDGTVQLYGEPQWYDAAEFEPIADNTHRAQTIAASVPDPKDQPEARSVTITIDHLAREDHPQGETVVPFLFSSADAHHVLLHQVPYFVKADGAANILLDPKHVSTVTAGFGRDCFYVYTPSARKTNLIVDEAIWARFVDLGGGTVLGGAAAAIQEAGVMQDNFGRAGRDTTLMAFVPDDEWFADECYGTEDDPAPTASELAGI